MINQKKPTSMLAIQENMTSALPSVMIGREGVSIKKKRPFSYNDPPPQNYPPSPSSTPQVRYDKDPLYDKLQKWGFILAVLVIVGYAIYRLLFG